MYIFQVEGDDPKPVTNIVSENMQLRDLWHLFKNDFDQFFFPGSHLFDSHLFLQLDAQGSLDCLKEAGCSAIFPSFNIVHIFKFAPGLVQSTVPPPGLSGTGLW